MEWQKKPGCCSAYPVEKGKKRYRQGYRLQHVTHLNVNGFGKRRSAVKEKEGEEEEKKKTSIKAP